MVAGEQIPDWSSSLQSVGRTCFACGIRKAGIDPSGRGWSGFSLLICSGKWLLTPSVVRERFLQREDLVQASSWPLGGIRDSTKSADQLCYEFRMVDIFLQVAIPEEGKLIHQLHSEGRLEKALSKYKLESCPNNDIWWQGISSWAASLLEFQLKLLQFHS